MQRINAQQYNDGEWSRLPHTARSKDEPGGRLRGLSRATLLELAAAGHVKIAAIRKPGALKAIRLVHLPTLDRYLQSLISGPAPVIPRAKKSRAKSTTHS
jgi:hypothetical protein